MAGTNNKPAKFRPSSPVIPGRPVDLQAGANQPERDAYKLMRELERKKAEIGDITLTDQAADDVLVATSATAWKNLPKRLLLTVDDLSNAATGGEVAGDLLEWNGTAYVNTRTLLASLTLAEAVDLILGTTTGTRLGTATTQKLAFFGSTPVVKPGALTQTYAVTNRTLAAYTSPGALSAFTGINNAQAGTVYAQLADLNTLRAAYETVHALVDNLAAFVNSLVDDLQALGLEG